MNVCDIIVPADMCVGCGICAGICPANCLQMRTRAGEYNPVLTAPCLSKCDLCLRACPFADHGDTISQLAAQSFEGMGGMERHPVVGHYLDCLMGWSLVPGMRECSASGGMATWTLERLMRNQDVDRVVAVVAGDASGGPLFRAAVLTSVTEIRQAASTRYYPVEFSDPLKRILAEKEDHAYAIVGLPCFIQGFRRAMNSNTRLRRRVCYLFALACGQCPSMHYTEALTAWSGMKVSQPRIVGYRFKDGTGDAQNFIFRAQDSGGKWSKPVGFDAVYNCLWGRKYFSLNPCGFCDDVFGELADATFMDAWLPSCMKDTRGTSMVVVRNQRLAGLYESGIERGECHLRPVSAVEVEETQMAAVKEKREHIRARLAWRRERGEWLPKMRSVPVESLSAQARRSVTRRMRRIRASKRLWPLARRLGAGLSLPVFILLVEGTAEGVLQSLRALRIYFRERRKSYLARSARETREKAD